VGVQRRGPGPRFCCITATFIAALLPVVWAAGQVAGLLVHGSWPSVSYLQPVIEVVRVVGGGAPAPGVPVALFWLCLVPELGTVVLLALNIRRRLQGRGHHVSAPRPSEGIAKPHSFRAGYRWLIEADAAQAAKVSAPPAEPTRDARIAWLGSAASSR
jgi:hypothetical protein